MEASGESAKQDRPEEHRSSGRSYFLIALRMQTFIDFPDNAPRARFRVPTVIGLVEMVKRNGNGGIDGQGNGESPDPCSSSGFDTVMEDEARDRASSASCSSSGLLISSSSAEEQQQIGVESLTTWLRGLNLDDDGDNDNGISQCLQAFELHAVGACRSDERLRPLLRWNLSCFEADGHFLGRLGLHFKAKEMAMLARCLCAPLVSVRVGKIVSHGQFLRPTATRGRLDLTMLPSSDLRLSFLEDGGNLEKLAMLTPSIGLELERITTDSSGRSFVLKLPANRCVFFWQSVKSKAAGDELVCKMKDILKRRPTLCQLTGIHESRLQSIASCLRTLFPAAPSPSCLAVSTRGVECAVVPPGSSTLALPSPLSDSSDSPQASSSTSDQSVTSVICSETVAAISSDDCFSLTSILGSHRLLRSSGEVDKKAFAQRILGSLPQTLVPFPLLVSSTALIPTLSPSLPVSSSSLYRPYYCPCPLGNVSALQSFASPHLPLLPSSSSSAAAASFMTVDPPPPLLPLPPLTLPEFYSVPLATSSSNIQELGSGPLIGLMTSDALQVYSSSSTLDHHIFNRGFDSNRDQ